MSDSVKWLLNNKLITLLITAILSGGGYGIKLLNDAAYQKGVNEERNNNLLKYEKILKDNNETLVELITLRIRCRECCPTNH